MQMWPDLIQKSKDGGLDVIETYIFWDLHEPVRNQVYDKFNNKKNSWNIYSFPDSQVFLVILQFLPFYYTC